MQFETMCHRHSGLPRKGLCTLKLKQSYSTKSQVSFARLSARFSLLP